MPLTIVIGNGFDLGCGLATSYPDFFSDQEKRKPFTEFCGDISSFADLSNAIIAEKIAPSDFLRGSFRPFQPIKDFTVWDALFCLLKRFDKTKTPLVNWYDVEDVMRRSLAVFPDAEGFFSWEAVFYFLRSRKGLPTQQPFQIGHGRYHGLECVVANLMLGYAKETFGKDFDGEDADLARKAFYDFLLQELHLFETRFMDYVSAEASKPGFADEAASHLSVLMDLGIIPNSSSSSNQIASFNYTSVRGRGPCVLKNIHGCCHDKNAIFGIDNKGIPKGDVRYPFTKQYRRGDLAATFSDEIGYPRIRENEQVIVFGHSLCKQDFGFFFWLFENLEVLSRHGPNSSQPRITFAYTEYPGKDIVESRKETLSSVRAMLVEYGEKNHNDEDLMEKLFVNDRIARFKSVHF